ncbi:hypothetical protein CBR_g31750 [Chara braunii]|uniref:Myb/SANT-like DNA-binding domain-containing protein n=1 Tax=Chara braunii TaxID=69332 RepID=A0A388JYF3_CHABU|nr:hypothetical protein CBR_g31750 [Chara braunii]|eukprot:GBG62733.1 hypothetical protein CBR_g31750 [Chara braunii]
MGSEHMSAMETSSLPVPPVSLPDGPPSPPPSNTTPRSGKEAATITDAPVGESDAKRASNKPARKFSQLWSGDEQVTLARVYGEGDALCASASGPHRCMRRQDRLEWISNRMREAGYRRNGEDCRKKWASLMDKAKEINDKCGRSGDESYWEMMAEKRRELGVHPAFDKVLWDAMGWALRKLSVTCEHTLASDNMQSQTEDVTSSGSGGRGKSARDASDGSDSGTKSKRARSRESLGNDDSPQSLSVAMRESTKAYCHGLEQAACTMVSATTKGAEIVGGPIGEMAGKIGAVADAMVGGNEVLAQLVGVLAARSQGSRQV